MTDLVFFVCDCVSWRLDVFEAALAKVLAAIRKEDEEARLVLAYRVRDDSALLVVSSQEIPEVLLTDLVLGHAHLPGLRRLPLWTASVSPQAFIRRRLSTCELSLRVTDPSAAVAEIRSLLGMESDRRVSRRLPVALPVLLKTAEGPVEGWTENISAGGLSIRTTAHLPLNTSIELQFFPRGEHPLSAEVTVVRYTAEGFGGRLELSYEAQRELYRRLRTIRTPLATAQTKLVQKWSDDDALVHVLGGASPEQSQPFLSQAVRASPAAMPQVRGNTLAVSAEPEPTPEAGEGEPAARVLLALGFDAIRKPLSRQLKHHHCTTLEARVADEAFQILVDEVLNLDLLVLDSALAGMSVDDFVFRIRELGGETELPIVLFTDTDSENRERLLLDVGVSEVLPLSLPTEALAASLVSLVSEQRRAALA